MRLAWPCRFDVPGEVDVWRFRVERVAALPPMPKSVLIRKGTLIKLGFPID